eukprot:IDg6439t1
MPPSLTYLAEHVIDSKSHTNLSWAINVTERVALIAVEWYRQMYVQFKMWKLNSWIYEQFENLGYKLVCVLGTSETVTTSSPYKRRVRRLPPRGGLGKHHDDVCYLNALSHDVLPWDFPVAPNAGGRAASLLLHPVPEVPVVDAVSPQDEDVKVDTS